MTRNRQSLLTLLRTTDWETGSSSRAERGPLLIYLPQLMALNIHRSKITAESTSRIKADKIPEIQNLSMWLRSMSHHPLPLGHNILDSL